MTRAAGSMAGTCTLKDASRLTWDIVIVGAGPAGALAALASARLGAHVLLVDQAAFPRPKACGGCLNGHALATLAAAQLGELPAQLGAHPIRAFHLFSGGHQAWLRLPSGLALSREALDAALVEQAIAAGASFLPSTHATLHRLAGTSRLLVLRHGDAREDIAARMVLAADGLAGTCLAGHTAHAFSVARASRIGIGAVLPAPPGELPGGAIVMACGRHGYVGLVQLECETFGIAAALDPAFLKTAGSPAAACTAITKEAGLPSLRLPQDVSWHGTPALTRRRRLIAAERLLILGDAAGYVEPLTGEGMAWALASATAAASIAVEGSRRWAPALAAQWTSLHRRLVIRRQWPCRIITAGLRHPSLARVAVAVLARAPMLASPTVRSLNRPPHMPAPRKTTRRTQPANQRRFGWMRGVPTP